MISQGNCEARNTVRIPITWGKNVLLFLSLLPGKNDLTSDSNDQTDIPSHR